MFPLQIRAAIAWLAILGVYRYGENEEHEITFQHHQKRLIWSWRSFRLWSRSHLHIFQRDPVIGARYCTEELVPHVLLFRSSMRLQFLFMYDSATPYRTMPVTKLLESEDIQRMDWPENVPEPKYNRKCVRHSQETLRSTSPATSSDSGLSMCATSVMDKYPSTARWQFRTWHW